MPCTVGAGNECTDGILTGNVTSRVDLGCGIGGVGLQDILAGGGTGGPIGLWPDDTLWHAPCSCGRRRTPRSGAPAVPATVARRVATNAYVTQIVPFPSAFTFSAIDTANLTTLYIGGTAPLVLPAAVLLQTAAYESSYPSQAGHRRFDRSPGRPAEQPADGQHGQRLAAAGHPVPGHAAEQRFRGEHAGHAGCEHAGGPLVHLDLGPGPAGHQPGPHPGLGVPQHGRRAGRR